MFSTHTSMQKKQKSDAKEKGICFNASQLLKHKRDFQFTPVVRTIGPFEFIPNKIWWTKVQYPNLSSFKKKKAICICPFVVMFRLSHFFFLLIKNLMILLLRLIIFNEIDYECTQCRDYIFFLKKKIKKIGCYKIYLKVLINLISYAIK
jgi:hypothetical protein